MSLSFVRKVTAVVGFVAAAAVLSFSFSESIPARLTSHTPRANAASAPRMLKAFGRLPLSFEPNRGQVARDVQYLAHGNGYSVLMRSREVSLVLGRCGGGDEPEILRASDMKRFTASLTQPRCSDKLALKMNFLGANSSPRVEGDKPLPGTTNYFIGKDRRRWLAGVPNYSAVRYHSLYPGVDAVFYGNRGNLEYDLVLAPGANPDAIAMRLDGVDRIDPGKNGDLILRSGHDSVTLAQPKIFQTINGRRQRITGTYRRVGRSTIAFKLASYDRAKPLVIDPTLNYSTYVGGIVAEAHAVAADAPGHAVIAGWSSFMSDYPTTTGAFDTALGGNSNGVVSELSPDGSTLVYSTYFGGTKNSTGTAGTSFDEIFGVAIDANGHIYIAGFTDATDFPTKATSVQGGTTLDQGAASPVNADGFVAELNPANVGSGNPSDQIIYSTYLGGTGFDIAQAISIDSVGNAYVVGLTVSNDFPTTLSAYQSANPSNGVDGEGFVTQLVVSGGSVGTPYSTYLGGPSVTNQPSGSNLFGVATEGSGIIYVAGGGGAQLPFTSNTLSGTYDGMVAKLNTTVSGTGSLLWGRYLGGSADDFLLSIALPHGCAANCNPYVTGYSWSSDFPTQNAVQPTFGGFVDAVVAELASADGSLIYSTYVGGRGYEVAQGITVDASGDAFITGITAATDYPTVNPIQASLAAPAGGLLASTDGGTTFSSVSGWPANAGSVALHGIDSDNSTVPPTLYFGTDQGLFTSTDTGSTFHQAAAAGLNGQISMVTVAKHLATPALLVGTSAGLFSSTDGAATFSQFTNLPAGLRVFAAGDGTKNLAEILVGTNNGFYISSDVGATFSAASGFPNGTQVLSGTIDKNTCSTNGTTGVTTCTLYLGTDRGIFSGVVSSNSEAATFSLTNLNFAPIFALRDDETTMPTTLYAGAWGSGVVASTDGFKTLTVGQIGALYPTGFGLDVNPPNVLAGISGNALGAVWTSTDHGATFSLTSNFVPGSVDPINVISGGASGSVVASNYLESDAFLTEIGAGGGSIPFSTYLGGHNVEIAEGIAMDGLGDVFVAGPTFSHDFPTAGTPFQSGLGPSNSGFINAFVTKFGSLPTSTATPTPNVTPTATASAGMGATPTPTATGVGTTPTATPTAGVCGAAAVHPLFKTFMPEATSRPPKLKPVVFAKQPLGTVSAPRTITLTNSTSGPLSITSVTLSGGDFLANSGCAGQTISPGTGCAVQLTYRPSRNGASHGVLSIGTSAGTVNAKLVGAGFGPKVVSLSGHSLPPFAPVTLNGSGFDPNAPVLVSFSETPKGEKTPLVFLVPVVLNNGSSVQTIVPPVFDPVQKALVPGLAKITTQELLGGGTVNSKSPSLSIASLNSGGQLPAGAAVIAFLQAEQNFANQLGNDVVGTPLDTSALQASLTQAANALGNLISILSGNPGSANLGSENGVQLSEDFQQLTSADAQILGMLNSMAGNNASSVRAAVGSGCLATEAAAALSDYAAGSSTAFSNDIAQLFHDSETSVACQQPGAATATLGIVNGAGGVALAIAAQGSNPSLAPLLPAEALLVADLGPGGQLLSIGASLAQSNPAAQEVVETTVASFNNAAAGQLNTVTQQSQGPIQTSYTTTTQTATSFNQAVPPPLDGSYAGSFSGTQFSGGTSCAIGGSLALSVSGTGITVTVPGGGSGTLDPNSGSATFTTTGVGGNSITCTFGGTFQPTSAGSANASGTWSCGASATFSSANGTWSATLQ